MAEEGVNDRQRCALGEFGCVIEPHDCSGIGEGLSAEKNAFVWGTLLTLQLTQHYLSHLPSQTIPHIMHASRLNASAALWRAGPRCHVSMCGTAIARGWIVLVVPSDVHAAVAVAVAVAIDVLHGTIFQHSCQGCIAILWACM